MLFVLTKYRALEAFIRAKYEQKKYIAKEWVPPKPKIPVRITFKLCTIIISKILCSGIRSKGLQVKRSTNQKVPKSKELQIKRSLVKRLKLT